MRMPGKLKVAFFLHQLQSYRVPILTLLAGHYDIKVICDNADAYVDANLPFEVIQRKIYKFGPFTFMKLRFLLIVENQMSS